MNPLVKFSCARLTPRATVDTGRALSARPVTSSRSSCAIVHDDLTIIESAIAEAIADFQLIYLRDSAGNDEPGDSRIPEIFLPVDQPGWVLLLQHLRRVGIDARVCTARYHGPIVIRASSAKRQTRLMTALAGLVLDAPKTTRSKTWISSKQHRVRQPMAHAISLGALASLR